MFTFLFLVVVVFAIVPIHIYNSCIRKSYMEKLKKRGFAHEIAKRIAIHHTEKVSRRFYLRYGLVMFVLSGIFSLVDFFVNIENISILITICVAVTCVSLGTFVILETIEIIKLKKLNKKRRKKNTLKEGDVTIS